MIKLDYSTFRIIFVLLVTIIGIFFLIDYLRRNRKIKRQKTGQKKLKKLNKKIRNGKRNTKWSNKKDIFFFSGVFIFLIVAFILFVPTKTVTYEIEVHYTATENYTEKEPYQTQESYQVQEPYQTTDTYIDTLPVEQSVPYTDYETIVRNAPSGRYYPNCSSDCTCTDYSFWTGNCIQCTCWIPVTKYKTEIVYKEVQKERPVTKYKTVTKYRTITKYKDVVKTREVLKTRMETREMEVNWIWGFKMPYRLHLPYISGE